MAKTSTTKKPKTRRVTFSIAAPEAGEIFLVGDFNNWAMGKHPMSRDGEGLWKKTVMLPPGIHEYKFLVDGEWREDPKNIQTCPNSFGSLNSVLYLT